MKLARLGFGGALALVVLACNAGSSSENAQTRKLDRIGAIGQAIQGGTTDTTHKYAVGVCGNGFSPGNCSSICSGALILPNLVVTARHCLDGVPPVSGQPSGVVDCSANPSFTSTKVSSIYVTSHHLMLGQSTIGWHKVKNFAVPPDDHICGNDIALLVLDSNVPGTEAKPIIPGIQYAMNDPRAKYLTQFTAIGYGNTGPNEGGAGTRRIRQGIRIRCIPGDSSMPCPAELATNEFVADDGTCSGDSGSSAYEQFSFERSTPVSFGVLSRGGESADGTTCEGSIYTRLDKFRDWVLEVAKIASNDWKAYPKPNPDWTIYVPPEEPKKDAGPTEPEKKGFGETCAKAADCESGLCIDPGDGAKICSQECTDGDDSTCPSGAACSGGQCIPGAASGPQDPAATTTTKTTEGCAVAGPGAPSPTGRSGAFAAAGAAIALILAKRRRTARRGQA